MHYKLLMGKGRILIVALLTIMICNSCKKNNENKPAGAPMRPTTSQSKKFVTTLFNYTPAPGQFINTDLGNQVAAESILGTNHGIVTLGAWGGMIILGFDHTVINRVGADDIIIYGNAFSNFSEPGIVWVMQDYNGNGKPDDQWYELAGSELNKAGYVRNYSVTYTRPDSAFGDVKWTDNQGQSGIVKKNAFHSQSYYPEWINTNQYTLTGSLLPATNINDSNPAFVTSTPFANGYADNLAGGNPIDIGNAIDNSGNKISLAGIDFIKIQTGIQYNLGSSGELSTDVSGIADMSIPL